MLNKKVAVLLVAVLLVAALVGCSESSNADSESGTGNDGSSVGAEEIESSVDERIEVLEKNEEFLSAVQPELERLNEELLAAIPSKYQDPEKFYADTLAESLDTFYFDISVDLGTDDTEEIKQLVVELAGYLDEGVNDPKLVGYLFTVAYQHEAVEVLFKDLRTGEFSIRIGDEMNPFTID